MTLVVVGASRNIARVAQSLCDEVIFVQQPGSFDPGLLRDDVDDLYTMDLDDHVALPVFAERVLRQREPRAVVSVTENGLEPAAVLSAVLGTPGTPLAVVRATRNKLTMRQTLAERAPALNVPFADPADTAATRELFATHASVIAKPVRGTASVGVHRLRGADGLADLHAPREMILEAFVPGVEVSVEAFSRHGRHDILAIAEKGTGDNFVEVSHLMPPVSLDGPARGAVADAVCELLDALGLRDGPTHTEVKVDGARVAVIETHNRPGGDGIADLVAATTGVDWRSVSLGWPLGRTAERGRPTAAAAANLFFTASPGRVSRIVDKPTGPAGGSLAYWAVDVEVGDVVGELRSSHDRLGMASVTGPSPRACLDFLEAHGHDRVVITGGAACVSS